MKNTSSELGLYLIFFDFRISCSDLTSFGGMKSPKKYWSAGQQGFEREKRRCK